ncbi:hypothetical protein MKX67_20990 [Cytobacillus sp. FSL W7-1323]
MDKEIESYINQIVNTIDCDHVEKQEIIDEMKDHIFLLMARVKKRPYSWL